MDSILKQEAKSQTKDPETARTSDLKKQPIQLKGGVIVDILESYTRYGFNAFELDTVIATLEQVFAVRIATKIASPFGEVEISDDYDTVTLKALMSRNFDFRKQEELMRFIFKLREGIICTLYEAKEELETIKKGKNYLPLIAGFLFFGLQSAALIPSTFGGTWYDTAVSFAGGIIVQACLFACELVPQLSPLNDFVSSVLVSTFIGLCASTSSQINFVPCFVASTVWNLPGYSMVIGFTELFSGMPVYGIIQVGKAVSCALSMALGCLIGILIAPKPIAFVYPLAEDYIDAPFRYLAIAVFGFSAAILFRSKLSGAIMTAFVAYVTGTWFIVFKDFPLFQVPVFASIAVYFFSSMAAQFCTTLLQLYSKQKSSALTSKIAPLTVALLPLCPGGMIVRGIVFFMLKQTDKSVATVGAAFIEAVAAALGLLFCKICFGLSAKAFKALRSK